MKAVSIIPKGPNAATAAAVEQALGRAVNGVTCELAYIGHLAELLSEQANDFSPDRLEAMCLSIRRMAESVADQLGQYHSDAATAATAAEQE